MIKKTSKHVYNCFSNILSPKTRNFEIQVGFQRHIYCSPSKLFCFSRVTASPDPPSSKLLTMCWTWILTLAGPVKKNPTRDSVCQTENRFFKRCECCHTILDLTGDDSLAGPCGLCQRKVCYMCVSCLVWDDSACKSANICDCCRDTYSESGFDKKYDIHELCN